jgi:FAD/FMN-containing dehydrogenase
VRGAESRLAGWGGLAVPGREVLSEDLGRVALGKVLTRGLARSYGDASLPPARAPEVAGSRLADRILALDPETALLRAEAGLSLAEIIRLFLPRGYWPPACPGTQFVTLGGAVAADVHGKSHHREGTFGRHVSAIRLLLADGRVVECGREENRDLFRATVGGMGLTGHILEVEVRLQRVPSCWIIEESERVPGLDRMIQGLRESAADWPFTVGWIDALARGGKLGRGVLIRGRWAEAGEAPQRPPRPPRRLAVPWRLPGWVLARPTVAAFNALYYRSHRRSPRRRLTDPQRFFFPLDAVLHWNRIYGRRGFTQFQCVVPEGERPGAARRVLEKLAERGDASFLCVIKDCGAEGEGLLSFPRPGISIAVDLPVRPNVQALIDALNERVQAEGGRIYLAKDRFTRREHFEAMEPRLEEFQAARRRWDPDRCLSSAQAERLLGG